MSDAIVMSISARGTVMKSKPRRRLAVFLLIRYVLYAIELILLIVCMYAVFSPNVTDEIECADYRSGPLRFARGVVITLLVTNVLYFVGFLAFCNPLGCCAPRLIPDRNDDEEFEENDAPNVNRSCISLSKYFRKLTTCRRGEHQTRGAAMHEVARAVHTVFEDTKLVLSDIVAGMMLVSKDQKRKQKKGECLVTEFRKVHNQCRVVSHST